MNSVRTLRKKVYVDSKFLDHNLNSYLREALLKETENECTKEDGYYISVKSIDKIEGNTILADCKVFDDRIVPSCQAVFTVIFQMIVFKPEVGMECLGTIYGILPTGVLVDFYKKQKALIPAPIEGYVYKEKVFQSVSDPEKSLVVGKLVSVKLKAVKYKDKKFTVFGNLIKSE